MMEKRHGAVVLGAGNVATSLVPALDAAGIAVRQIYSRTPAKAAALAASVGAEAVSDFKDIAHDADIYIVCLADNAIAPAAQALAGTGGLWMHTSGGTPADALAPATSTYGVLYPLQTFSAARALDMRAVPLFTEGCDAETEQRIDTLARSISDTVSHAGSPERLRLHAAAVFACNYVNHLWALADIVLKPMNLDIKALSPLINETLAKAMTMPPAQAQTGPAVRGDSATIARHLAILPPDLAGIYTTLADSIAALRDS